MRYAPLIAAVREIEQLPPPDIPEGRIAWLAVP